MIQGRIGVLDVQANITRVEVYSQLGNVVHLEAGSATKLSSEFHIELCQLFRLIDARLSLLILEEVKEAVAELGVEQRNRLVYLVSVVALI